MSDMGEFMMVRMNAGSVLFLAKCRYVTIYYLSGLFYVKAQNRQHLPLGWMLAFLCCGVESGDGKQLLSYSSEHTYGRLQDEHCKMGNRFTTFLRQ